MGGPSSCHRWRATRRSPCIEQDGQMLFAPQSKRDVLHFLNETWAPNLRAQRFIEAAQKLAVPVVEVTP